MRETGWTPICRGRRYLRDFVPSKNIATSQSNL